jgi:hypothetical protein
MPARRQPESLADLAARVVKERRDAYARIAELEAEMDGIRRVLAGFNRRSSSADVGGHGRQVAVAPAAREKRRRKPITDPVVVERRRQALVRARATRTANLAAARAAQGRPPGQETDQAAREP